MNWVALGDSVTGTSHAARDIPCQDAFRVRPFGPGGAWLVVAVADGAGSSSHADIGAALACDEFVRHVEAAAPNALGTRAWTINLFSTVRGALMSRAESLGVRPRELACTALLALLGPASATFAQLGDGAIVIGTDADRRVVFWPEPGEYANATDFLTDDEFVSAIQFEEWDAPVTELAVLTDGLQRLALNFATRTPHPEFFQPLFRRLRAEPDVEALFEPFRQFLGSPRVNERTDDDKTLVLAVYRP